MTTEPADKPAVPALAETIAAAMPPLRPHEQRLALALYRRLARGDAVSPGAFAGEIGGDPGEIERILSGWPGVFRDDRGRVVGFWGLALPEMPHCFNVAGRRLYAWCAWDALFIPELIGARAEVQSHSPASGDEVRLSVSPHGVERVEPASAVVSMLAPRESFDHDVIMGFCHFVHFFASRANAEPWLADHEGTFLLSLDEAFELGRLTNRLRYPDALESAAV